MRHYFVIDDPALLAKVCGTNDEYLAFIEKTLSVKINTRGNEIFLESGEQKKLQQALFCLEQMISLARTNRELDFSYIHSLLGAYGGKSGERKFELKDSIPVMIRNRDVLPRNENQKKYLEAIGNKEITFALGPAGTGKTYLAIAYALQQVFNKKVKKLVLTRPVVEAGETLGFLPGDLTEKLAPYLRPLYDAIEDLIPIEQLQRLKDNNIIEVSPLAYMRGRTLKNSFVVLDEAQNTTVKQMKMFLTRLGEGTQAVITGDPTQIDLPRSVKSGLIDAEEKLFHIKEISFQHFDSADVVRKPLIRKIIDAYEKN